MPSIQQNAWLIGNTASLSIMILKAVLHKEQHFLVAVIEPLLLLKRGVIPPTPADGDSLAPEGCSQVAQVSRTSTYFFDLILEFKAEE